MFIKIDLMYDKQVRCITKMKKREDTDAKAEKYSWLIRIDKNLRAPCRIIADAKNCEVRELLSDIVREHLPEVTPV
jgi:hypothetical protein